MATSPKFNGRAIAMILTGMFVIVMLAVPVRSLIAERREISKLENNLVAQQATIDDLNNRRLRLSDPAYLQTLARQRLNYVFPGEVGFVVLDEETNTAISSVSGALVPNDDSPWYTKLWTSTKLADHPPAKNDPLVVQSENLPQ